MWPIVVLIWPYQLFTISQITNDYLKNQFKLRVLKLNPDFGLLLTKKKCKIQINLHVFTL